MKIRCEAPAPGQGCPCAESRGFTLRVAVAERLCWELPGRKDEKRARQVLSPRSPEVLGDEFARMGAHAFLEDSPRHVWCQEHGWGPPECG